MTDTQQPYAPIRVNPDADSRLAQLQAAYRDAKAERDAAEAKYKGITDAIKSELSSRVPEGVRKVELLGAVPLALTYAETWRFDSTRFKRDDPHTYVKYAKQSGSWTLREVKGGDPE